MKQFKGFLGFVLVMTTTVAQAQMYKCVQGGQTTYQAQPCPQVANQQSLNVKNISTKEIERTIEFMATYQACAQGMSFWKREMAAPYEAWRTRNMAIVARIEQDPQRQAQLQERIDDKGNESASMCRPVALELRGIKEKS